MADFADLDWAFTCPPSVTDDDLRAGYEVLVSRFRAEGSHLPLNTAFQLKIERVISFYIKVKQAERQRYGQPGGFQHAGQEKDANVQLNTMLDGVSEMLKRHHPNADREMLLLQVKDVILEALREVPDGTVRDDLARRFAVKFEQAGF